MQEDESTENTTDRPEQPRRSPQPGNPGQPTHGAEIARHRLRSRLGGSTPYVVAGVVAALGLGLAGVAAATDNGTGTPGLSSMTAADEQARAETADRGGRSQRDAPGDTPATADDATTDAPTSSPSADALATPGVAEKAAPKKSAAPAAKSTPTAERSTPAQRATTQATATAAWVHPMPGASTTSCFGQRWGVLHAGIDLAMPANTPIRAAGAGTIIEAGWAYSGYGISVLIDHGNGLLTHYAHLNSTAVQVGQKVTTGKVIGYEGSTGDSTGPHLHFEVHNGLWNQLDPGPWMRSRGVNLGC